MTLTEIIESNRPDMAELQRFSAGLSDLIGSVNPLKAAYKAVVLQRFVELIRASDDVIPFFMSIAEQQLKQAPMIIDRGVCKSPDGKPISEIDKKRLVLQRLLHTLHLTHTQVRDLVLHDDGIAEIIYANGTRKRISVAADSETEMICNVMNHL